MEEVIYLSERKAKRKKATNQHKVSPYVDCEVHCLYHLTPRSQKKAQRIQNVRTYNGDISKLYKEYSIVINDVKDCLCNIPLTINDIFVACYEPLLASFPDIVDIKSVIYDLIQIDIDLGTITRLDSGKYIL